MILDVLERRCWWVPCTEEGPVNERRDDDGEASGNIGPCVDEVNG